MTHSRNELSDDLRHTILVFGRRIIALEIAIAKLSVLAGAISSCGSYVTIVSGLPEWSVKVFQVSTGACIIQHSIGPTDEQILHFSHCPNDWRQLALVSKSCASLITIEPGISKI